MKLSIDDHDRDKAGLRYVYPVVSRRAGALSIGVNLNPNNACNWRCVYCQVPGLSFGNAPELDLVQLEAELGTMVASALDADWMERHVPAEARRLHDVAISGNGEPTSSRQLGEVIALIERVLRAADLLGRVPVVLITNGSLAHKAQVQASFEALARIGGRIWFKLDSATAQGRARINTDRAGVERALDNLISAARRCPTWIQTMALDFQGPTLAGAEEEAYVEHLRAALAGGAELRGVLLYGLARPSHQPEAEHLRPLPTAELQALAERIARATGLEVRAFP